MSKERFILRASRAIAGKPGVIATKLATPAVLNFDFSLLKQDGPGIQQSEGKNRINRFNLFSLSVMQAAEVGSLYFFLSRGVWTGAFVYTIGRFASLYSEIMMTERRNLPSKQSSS